MWFLFKPELNEGRTQNKPLSRSIVVWLTRILKLIGLIETIEFRPWSACFYIWVFVRGSFEQNKYVNVFCPRRAAELLLIQLLDSKVVCLISRVFTSPVLIPDRATGSVHISILINTSSQLALWSAPQWAGGEHSHTHTETIMHTLLSMTEEPTEAALEYFHRGARSRNMKT